MAGFVAIERRGGTQVLRRARKDLSFTNAVERSEGTQAKGALRDLLVSDDYWESAYESVDGQMEKSREAGFRSNLIKKGFSLETAALAVRTANANLKNLREQKDQQIQEADRENLSNIEDWKK